MFYTEFQIDSDLNRLVEVEHFIENIMADFCIDDDYLGILSVPLLEAVNNAIVHGNHMDHTKKVRITCQLANKQITFSVSDEGKGFDYSNIRKENIENRKSNGLSTIELLSVEIEFLDNGSTITYKLNVPFQIPKERDNTFTSKKEIKQHSNIPT